MIKNSFIFLDKISQASEKKLWQQKILHWDDFVGTKNIQSIGNARKVLYDQQIAVAHKALQQNDAVRLSKLFPKSEHWRLYDMFKDETCYLDIETSGYYGDITVVGIYDGRETKTMVKGKNLDPHVLKNLLQQYKMIISFNGSSFDLPIINKYYPNTIPDMVHIDLRHVLAKLGFSGGLKKIEKQLGIKRAEEVSDIKGSDAVYLWNMYKATGKENYLELLVKYNEEDIVNLKPLAEFAYKEMKNKIFDSVLTEKLIL
ncbi:MAG: ribonuclease H-like domain-containing protein [Candidatus Woesearchaeota archaeon]|jgi:hypothetical protein